MNKAGASLLIMCILFVSLAASMPSSTAESTVPSWKEPWQYRQELLLPLALNDSSCYYQPIDMHLSFNNPCWTKNVNETSIRIVWWDGDEWEEIESQIYNLEPIDSSRHISSCSIVFLVPEGATATDRFFVYYHDQQTPPPEYIDHVSVENAYYFDSPIEEIKTEAQYYAIRQHGYCIYGVGQEGKLLDRPFSQVVAKQKEASREFDVFDSDLIASFAFSYYYGSNEKDESSSDQLLLDKKIFVDGNLMVEFGILSESQRQDVQTNAIYKYYYCPRTEKRLSVRVRHSFSEAATVKGKVNIDGRFGSIYSIQAKSQTIDRLNTGQIFPYLFVYGESNDVEEFKMNTNPETKQREWILSYEDDVDLGKQAWFAYGDTEQRNIHALIFHSNQGIVKQGTSERDGIQLKVAVREYIDFLGTEIDYASINFGRNSYEDGFIHDLNIPEDYLVEFDAELFSKKSGGYTAVQQEAAYFQELVKYRMIDDGDVFDPDVKTYDLSIHTHLGGTRLSYPLLANVTNQNIPRVYLELYHKNVLVASATTNRSVFYRSYHTFKDVPQGTYLLKVFWKLSDTTSYYTAYKQISLLDDTSFHILCTWQRQYQLHFIDQNQNPLSEIMVYLDDEEGTRVAEGTTNENGDVTLEAPIQLRGLYHLNALYRGVIIHEGEIQNRILVTTQEYTIPLFELTVKITDLQGFAPAVDINPHLTDVKDQNLILIDPEGKKEGTYYFPSIPEGRYLFKISYGTFQKKQIINLSSDKTVDFLFSAEYILQLTLMDSQGHALDSSNFDITLLRQNKPIQEEITEDLHLPPANYTLQVFDQENLIGIKDIELTASRSVTLVTSITSVVPLIVLALSLVAIIAAILLRYFKRLTTLSMLSIFIIGLIVIALIQPWWALSGENNSENAQRYVQLYVAPQVMIEANTIHEQPYYDIAELPEIFLSLLEQLYTLLVIAGFLIGLSVLVSLIQKRRYSIILLFAGLILVFITSSSFYIGIQRLTELSLGQLQGTDTITVIIGQETISMVSSWGLSTGWYLLVISFIIGCIAFGYQLRNVFKKLFRL